MLLQRYRYLLILKVLLLIGGTILVRLQPPHTYTGGTLVVITHPETATIHTALEQLSAMEMPWSVVSLEGTGYFVHIPRTQDTGFVAEYLSQPLPPRHVPIEQAVYTDACQQQLIVSQNTSTTSPCHLFPELPTWLPRSLILLGLIL